MPNPAQPWRNLYGERSFPALDSVDVWPMLTQPSVYADADAAHEYLMLSKEVLLAGRWKLVRRLPSAACSPAHPRQSSFALSGARARLRGSAAGLAAILQEPEQWVEAARRLLAGAEQHRAPCVHRAGRAAQRLIAADPRERRQSLPLRSAL